MSFDGQMAADKLPCPATGLVIAAVHDIIFSELQIRGGIEDNSKIIFLISQ